MKNSKIQWTNATYNPWYGCKKVSLGCRNCYMFRDMVKFGKNPNTIMKSKTKFNEPIKWKVGKLIFTCSWSDWFIEEADEWRDEAWEVIRQTPQHTYQILTKRPERIKDHLPPWFDEIADRVWIGVTVESQDYVERIKYLRDLPCITYVSFEPLIGPIQWNENMNELDWCIVGGESGNETGKYLYRPMELKWAEDLVKNARNNKVKCFVKQMGTYQSKQLSLSDRHGGDINEFPVSLQVRQYP